MLNKIITSFKNINHKLFISLLVMGLVPTIYTTLRVFWLGNLPGDWSYSIAGQLSWINLIYEVINEAIILPLFYFVGKVLSDKKELTNRMKTGLLITLGIYIVLSIFIMTCTNPLLKAMATDPSIIDASATYIRIEAIANVFGILSQFALVGLVTLGKDKLVYILTGVKLVLCIFLDLFLVSTLSCSANLGVNGIGVTNIIVNALIFGATLFLLARNGVNVFNKEMMSFTWAKEFARVGGISGLESFVRNLAYMVMIARMVNVVNEQGTYWVANNFIWGWLLLPITQLGELIKQETSTNKNAVKNNTLGYFTITTITVLAWCILIPLYKPFMTYVLNFSDVDKLFELVMVLFGFYILYAIQNICDATFYGLGKTHYMLFESIVTNTLYYGTAFILWKCGVWTPSLIGIALLFGIGNAFDTVVSLGAYRFLLKKQGINILDVEAKSDDIISSSIKIESRIKKNWNRILNSLQYAPTLIITILITIVLLCNNFIEKIDYNSEYFSSLSYAIIVFVLGIIITLKLKILDFKEDYYPIFKKIFKIDRTVISNKKFKKNEAISFSFFVFFNILYLFCAYWLSSINDKKPVAAILITFNTFDFVVLVRNVFILGKIYKDDIFKKNNAIVNFETLKIDKNIVEDEMHQLEKIINYKFDNIEYLEKAMYAKKISSIKNNDEHANHAMATFGDAILKAILSQKLYEEGKTRGEITSNKSELENNKVLYDIVNDEETYIIDYAFHDTKFFKDHPKENEKVCNSEHSQYLEAIIAAIYYDSSFEITRNWVNNWLIPKMQFFVDNNEKMKL